MNFEIEDKMSNFTLVGFTLTSVFKFLSEAMYIQDSKQFISGKIVGPASVR